MLATPAYLISDDEHDAERIDNRFQCSSFWCQVIQISGQDAALIKVREQIEKVSALETPILKDEIERAHRDQQEISDRFAHWQHQEALKIELLTLL